MTIDPTRKTQAEKILAYINSHGNITQTDALIEIGCMRLASRINDLRNAGHKILTEMIDVPTHRGTTVRIAQYKIAEV